MNSLGDSNFVETLEHRRFTEFCDACGRYRYIGYLPSSSGDLIAILRLGGLGQPRYASLLAKFCTPLILS